MSSLDMSQLAGLGNPPGMAFAQPRARGGMVRATQARGYVQPGTRARPTPAARAAPRPTRWNPAVRSARPQPTRTRTVTRTRAQPVPRRQAPRAQPTPRPTPVPRTRTRTVRRARPQPVRRAPQPPKRPQSSFWDRAVTSTRLGYGVAKGWAEEKSRVTYNDMIRRHIRAKRDEALRRTQAQKQNDVRRALGKQAADLFGKLTKSEQNALYAVPVQDSYSKALRKHVKRRPRRTR